MKGYSKSTGGFYSTEIHGEDMPADVVEITEEHYADLLAGQAAGKRIVPGPDGYPVLADQPAPTDEELAAAIRAERNARIAASDWTQLPDAPLTSAQRTAWATYRQALRDITGQATFPASVDWPTEPA